MFNERKIRIFLHVCRTKSFTETARQMFLSQQSVSKSISELEADVGKKLFYRQYRGLELTPDGTHCRQMFIHFMRAYDSFASNNNSPAQKKRIIRVGYLKFCSYGPEYGQTYAEIKAQNPAITFIVETLTPEDILSKINCGALDMAFTRNVLLPREYTFFARRICSNQTYLCVSACEPRVTPTASVDDFNDIPFIVNSIEGETEEQSIARGQSELIRFGLSPRPIIIAPDRETAMHYAESGNGVITASSSSLVVHSAALQLYPLKHIDETMCIWYDSENTPLINKCCDLLQSALMPPDTRK